MMSGLRDGIVKRGNTWSYVVRVPDPATGLTKPRWVGGFATEKAAKDARDEARRAARRGEYVDRNVITVSAYLEQWLDSHAIEVRPRTLAGYRFAVRQYVKPHIGSMRLQAVRPSTLSSMYRTLLTSGGRKGRPLSQRSVEYVHAVLRKAFNDAVKVEELIPTNPVERAKRPRRENKGGPVEVWTAAELRTFLGLVKDHRLYAYYRLAAYSGARRGELLNARWPDVDWRSKVLRIRGSAGIVSGKRVEGATKSGYERVVSLDGDTVDALKAHRRRQMEEMSTAGEAWTDTGHLFTTGFGLPIYPDTVGQLMAKTIKAYNESCEDPDAALRPARLHDLRHVHATHLLLAGVAVHVVAERLGHADPSITLRVYAHVIRKHTEGIADVFADAMDSTDEDDDDDGSAGVPAVPC